MIADIHDPHELIDKHVVAESFSRAAPHYDSAAYLQRLIAQQLLCWMPRGSLHAPILDLGCGTGFVLEQILRDQPDAECIGLDIAEGMLRFCQQRFADSPQLHWLGADAENLPLPDHCISVVTSNFALQWCGNLSRAFSEVHRVLVPKGRFLLTLPAQDTLWELKESWRAADPAHTHVSHFVDEEHLRRAARQAGLKIARMALVSRCMYYPTVAALADELKTLGAHNATVGRMRTLTPKGVYRRMLAHYEQRRTTQGKLPATWRVLLVEMVNPHG